MKTITFILAISCLSLLTYCQHHTNSINNLFDKYGDMEGISSITLNGNLPLINQIMGSFDLDESLNDELDFEKFSTIRILNVNDKEAFKNLNFLNEVKPYIDQNDFKEMMKVKEKNQDLRILVREESGKITEVLIVSGGNDNFLLSMHN